MLAVPWNNVEEALSGLPAYATNPFTQVSPKLILTDLKGSECLIRGVGS